MAEGQAIHNLELMERWILGSAKILDGITAPKSPRTAIPGAMFHLGIQYQHSISVLCRNGLYAGAFALLRPLVEAMFRGAWLRFAATDQQISDFADGKPFPGRNEIDRDLKKTKPRYTKIRAHLDRTYGEFLHDFTHGGHQQMWSRIRDGSICEGHEEENVENLLHVAAILGYICSVEIATSCESRPHADRLQGLFYSIFPRRGTLNGLANESEGA
ncbi:Uncharacterised protein [Achromobacter kerstersii]|nr:Uncharacterised protein [Achromobacter kerstersii]